jgi:hypothetical protein
MGPHATQTKVEPVKTPNSSGTGGAQPLSAPLRRLPVSPIEGAIFAAVLGGFVYSVVGLFHERATFTALLENETSEFSGSLTRVESSGTRSPASASAHDESKREPASVANPSDSMRSFDFQCDLAGEKDIMAGKVRISGPFCKGTGTNPQELPLKTTLFNEATQFTATVFMDSSAGKFSTDYIPLNIGSNPIQIEFRYANGNSVKKAFVLNKK